MGNLVTNVVGKLGITNCDSLFSCEDGTKYFDFNKIIPMPEELNMESGSIEYDAIEAVFRYLEEEGILHRRYHTLSNDEWKYRSQLYDDLEELRADGLRYLTNMVKYGATSWYRWRDKNWGTEWNSSELEVISDDIIRFKTVRCTPEPVIKKLSQMFPNDNILLLYSDECGGYNAGAYLYNNGELVLRNQAETFDDVKKLYELCWDAELEESLGD